MKQHSASSEVSTNNPQSEVEYTALLSYAQPNVYLLFTIENFTI